MKRGRLRLETLEVLTLLKANTQLIEDYGIDIDTTEETAVTGLTASEESFDDESETEGSFPNQEVRRIFLWKLMTMRMRSHEKEQSNLGYGGIIL